MTNLAAETDPDKARPPLRLTIPLERGELRVARDGTACSMETWTQYPGGRAMMAGGLRLTASDVRLAIHALRYVLWDLERAEADQASPSQDLAA